MRGPGSPGGPWGALRGSEGPWGVVRPCGRLAASLSYREIRQNPGRTQSLPARGCAQKSVSFHFCYRLNLSRFLSTLRSLTAREALLLAHHSPAAAPVSRTLRLHRLPGQREASRLGEEAVGKRLTGKVAGLITRRKSKEAFFLRGIGLSPGETRATQESCSGPSTLLGRRQGCCPWGPRGAEGELCWGRGQGIKRQGAASSSRHKRDSDTLLTLQNIMFGKVFNSEMKRAEGTEAQCAINGTLPNSRP